MRGRLIEPLERWLLDWPLLAIAATLVWRLAAGVLLWGERLQLPPLPWNRASLATLWPLPGVIESMLLGLAAAAALLLLVRLLVPRDYCAAAALAFGGSAFALAATAVPRHGWLLDWPLGRMTAGWYIAVGLLLLCALALSLWLHLRWKRQLRRHGIEWTKQWAQRHSYSARRLALRALRYMGDWETE